MANIATDLDMGYTSPKEISENAGTIFAHATDGEKNITEILFHREQVIEFFSMREEVFRNSFLNNCSENSSFRRLCDKVIEDVKRDGAKKLFDEMKGKSL